MIQLELALNRKQWTSHGRKAEDSIGEKFGKLTALAVMRWTKTKGEAIMLVRCDCGFEFETGLWHLRSGDRISCGCHESNSRQPMRCSIGKRFGRLLVLSLSKRSRTSVVVVCDCGVKKEACLSSMKNGNVKSCGCAQREWARVALVTHGLSKVKIYKKEYRAWMAARDRCNNPQSPSYHHYGGRGICVCPQWSDFATFIADIGPAPSAAHSLDRFPNMNGNYEPGNVRWATKKQQARNRRGLTLNEEMVEKIRALRKTGMSQRMIGLTLGCPIYSVVGVTTGKYWS